MSTDRELFARTHNGIDVYVESGASHVTSHFQDNPKLEELAKEVVRQNLMQRDQTFRLTTTSIGQLASPDLVETGDNDEIICTLKAYKPEESIAGS